MRNFYCTANIDGRKEPISFGPRSKNGVMSLDLHVNNSGKSESAVRIYCTPFKDGKLGIAIYIKDHPDPIPIELYFNQKEETKK